MRAARTRALLTGAAILVSLCAVGLVISMFVVWGMAALTVDGDTAGRLGVLGIVLMSASFITSLAALGLWVALDD